MRVLVAALFVAGACLVAGVNPPKNASAQEKKDEKEKELAQLLDEIEVAMKSQKYEDVENSAWHYLCNARANSPKRAREDLIPVTKDARVPMKQVLELFAGKIAPKDVLDSAENAKLKDEPLKSARFYAHLYVALYY